MIAGWGIGFLASGLPQWKGRVKLCVLVALAGVAALATAAPSFGAAVVTWQAPTPPAGAKLSATTSSAVSFKLAASVSGVPGATVRIAAQGLPAGAVFRAKDGAPATASFKWTPAANQAGDYIVTFTADVPTVPTLAATPRSFLLHIAQGPPPVVYPQKFTLSGQKHAYRWAKVVRPTVARKQPRRSASGVGRLTLLTPEWTPNMVLMLEGTRFKNGQEWIRVRLAKLPNNTTGWVPRSSLGRFRLVRTRLVVSRSALKATLYRAGKPIFRARVGIGQSQWPTPRGEFYIRNKLSGYNNPVYGPIAFGTSALSATLTDWPGGGFVGIHGTNAPQILPGRVSHGCIRMRNPDILRLAKLMPVGTPVSVV